MKSMLMSRFAARGLRLACASAFSVAVLGYSSANAAPIVYGDFDGDTVMYLDVQEESSTDPGASLFGAPTIGGDGLDFDPQAFAASSTGLDSDVTDSNLQFTVMAKPGFGVTSITFSEAGDTSLSGLAGDAQTTVAALFFVDILEVNIAGVLTPVSVSATPVMMTFSPQDSWLLSVDGPGSRAWTGSLFLDLGPTLAANGLGNATATKVGVSLNNTLTASSTAGAAAFIQKKDADARVVTIETKVIPEPASLATLVAALAVASVGRRRA